MYVLILFPCEESGEEAQGFNRTPKAKGWGTFNKEDFSPECLLCCDVHGKVGNIFMTQMRVSVSLCTLYGFTLSRTGNEGWQNGR